MKNPIEEMINRRMANAGESREEAVATIQALFDPPGPMVDWWLSFADETGFLGVCIVSAASLPQAAQVAHRLGCNPGGQIQGHTVPEDIQIDSKWKQRLLSKEECDAVLRSQER
jgi:hypothetical protein